MPDLAALDRLEPVRQLPGRNLTKATVLLYRAEGVGIAVKTYTRSPFLIRHLLGRWLIAREAAAYRAAGTITGLPRFYGRCGLFALATEWVEAVPLARYRNSKAAVGEQLFDRVAEILDELHRRGVALGDLHHRDVLVGDPVSGAGEVFLIDLATAWCLGDNPGPFRRYLFDRLRDADQVSLARMRARFTGGDVEAAIAAVGASAADWHRRGRWVKSLIDRLRGKRRCS